MKTLVERKSTRPLSPNELKNSQFPKLDLLMKNSREEAKKVEKAQSLVQVRYSINEADKIKIRNILLSSTSTVKSKETKQECKEVVKEVCQKVEELKEELQELTIECCNHKQIITPSNSFYESNLPSENILKYFESKSCEWKKYKKSLVDSHCHFDMLFPKIKYNNSSIYKYFQDFSCFYMKNFEACINVICNPRSFSNKNKLKNYFKNYSHPKIYHTIGYHPHFADLWTPDSEDALMDALIKHPKVVALGECGLDLSKNNSVDFETQIKVFQRQLLLASEKNIPIVIHCRDTEEKCYEMLKEYLEPDHLIHLHCFTGSTQIALKYLKTFPNLCIGVTPLITFKKDHVKQMIKSIPLERILLETDSPYFVPQIKNFPNSDVKVSHPGFIFATAESIAELKEVSIDQVIDVNRNNVRKIYSF